MAPNHPPRQRKPPAVPATDAIDAHFETVADFSAGAASYIEDCQVCCQPMELILEVDADGALAGLTARRTD